MENLIEPIILTKSVLIIPGIKMLPFGFNKRGKITVSFKRIFSKSFVVASASPAALWRFSISIPKVLQMLPRLYEPYPGKPVGCLNGTEHFAVIIIAQTFKLSLNKPVIEWCIVGYKYAILVSSTTSRAIS